MEIPKSLMNWPILSMLKPEFIWNIDMVVVHGKEALIVTYDRVVYALGSNKDGCSGVGNSTGCLIPTRVIGLNDKNIKTFAPACSAHVLALTEDGKVYSWGNNWQYQLGNKFNNTCYDETPTIVQGCLDDKFVVDIACGSFYSLALTGTGEVYEWGNNIKAQYTRIINKVINRPQKVQSTFHGKRIVSISCGNSFSMAVTTDGEVYGWGDNEYGQLGIENYNAKAKPCKITKLTGIVIEKVVCGFAHTLALSNEGILYTWGENTYGQLGCPTPTKACSPVQLNMTLIGRVLDMAASHYNHISVALGEGNCVFIWGHCLGQSIEIPEPTPHKCLYDALACYATPSIMHKPFLLHGKGTKNLTDCLKGAFDDPTMSDLAIQVEGCPIHVHKAILKIRCQHFRTMFQEHWAENNQSIIQHGQFSYDVYRAFLEYLYTDEINVSVEEAIEFLDLTNAYSESQLQSRWIRLIKKDITVKNAITLLIAAIQYNAKELEAYCFQFAVNKLTAVEQRPSFCKLDEHTKKSIRIKAANAGASKTSVESYQNIKTTTRNLKNWKIIRSLEPKFISTIHMVIVHGNYGNGALIITKDGVVYGLGINACVGSGDACTTLRPTEVKALSGKDIKTFAYATDEFLALTEKGEVYSWGSRGGQELPPTLLEDYPSETFVVDLACGKYHSLALTNDGKVYAWGKNTHGQLDGSSTCYIEDVCTKVGVILPDKKIVYIRCCSESSMAVTDGGEVYSWGCNTKGELGLGHCDNAIGVHKVEIPTEVVIEKIACGQSHTLALSNEGVLYVWGANTHGQLGCDHGNEVSTPVKLQVEEMGRVLDVAASPFNDISAAMSEHNRVFVWGLCLEQKLAVPTRTPFEHLYDVFAHHATCGVMPQPLIVGEEISITDNLRQAFDDAATSDLAIHVGGKSIYVHKTILKIRSQYFRTMLQEHCAETDQSGIKHEQFCYDVCRGFLEYLYTDEINIPAANIHDLAITYSDSVLRDRCIQLLKRGITVDNVASNYGISIKLDVKELEQFCLNFAINTLSSVVETPDFYKLDEFTTKSLIMKAGKAGAFKR